MQPRQSGQEDLVEKVATRLMYPAKQITTLEIKMELRKEYPQYPWYQQLVSEIMIDLQQAGKFDYQDQGRYRIYHPVGQKSTYTSTNTNVKSTKVKRTRTSAITDISTASKLISGAGGKFLTVILKTGKTLNCRFALDFGDTVSVTQIKDGRNHVFTKSNLAQLSLDHVDYTIQ